MANANVRKGLFKILHQAFKQSAFGGKGCSVYYPHTLVINFIYSRHPSLYLIYARTTGCLLSITVYTICSD